MIGTADTKAQQLQRGYWELGSGREKILVVGSCRSVAYLNYLARINASTNRFTIRFIDPFNWHWTADEQLVDLEQAILNCESNPSILKMLEETEIFIHEWYAYYGMWNTNRVAGKSIYDFGMNPRLDICIPNYHDRFVLFQDQVNFNVGGCVDLIRAMKEVPVSFMRASGLEALEKFYDVCRLSSFPEFSTEFKETWTAKRYFWSYNHVASPFNLYLFRQINDRFLHLELDDAFWIESSKEDQFCKPCSPVTKYDVEAFGLTWNAPIEELKIP